MASVAFDDLWDDAFEREGELYINAKQLAQVYAIHSGAEAIRLAKVFHEAGQSFYDYCDAAYRTRQSFLNQRLKRRYHLSDTQLAIIKNILTKKAKKGG